VRAQPAPGLLMPHMQASPTAPATPSPPEVRLTAHDLLTKVVMVTVCEYSGSTIRLERPHSAIQAEGEQRLSSASGSSRVEQRGIWKAATACMTASVPLVLLIIAGGERIFEGPSRLCTGPAQPLHQRPGAPAAQRARRSGGGSGGVQGGAPAPDRGGQAPEGASHTKPDVSSEICSDNDAPTRSCPRLSLALTPILA